MLMRQPLYRAPREELSPRVVSAFENARKRILPEIIQKEYADATDEPIGKTRELAPLNGQTVDPVTGAPIGDRADLKNVYGSGRVDYYLNNGSVLTADGGAAQVQNEVFVTGIGRVQVVKAIRPSSRARRATSPSKEAMSASSLE